MKFIGRTFRVGLFFVATVLSITPLHAKSANDPEAKARQLLREKILNLGQDLDLKEGSYNNGRSYGKETNANDKNSFLSNTTYHSYVWEYCLKWVGGRLCRAWMYPYISLHGMHGDRSPLEGEVYASFMANQPPANGGGGNGGVFGVWEIESQGNFLKRDGTLDRERMTAWRLKKDVLQRIRKIGEDTAARSIANTFGPGEKRDGSVMPNMEALRRQAAILTKSYRNRMLANIGEIRAAQPGIEFALGEDIPDCQNYLAELRKNPDRTRAEDRIDPQKNLDWQTRFQAGRVDQRMQMCQQARQMNAYAVNVRPVGRELRSTGTQGEWIDAALSRVALATVDYTGIDPRSVPIDKRIQLREDQVKSEVSLYDDGGKNLKKLNLTNGQVLNAYNKNLKGADNALQGVSKRTGRQFQNGAASKWSIAPKQMNMVKLNDLTPEMRDETSMTDSSKEPGENLEMTPNELLKRQ